MKKMFLILGRELWLRLRRPSFWVLTLAVPILVVLLYALPVVAASHANRQSTILVVDETGLFDNALHSSDRIGFRSMPSLDYARRQLDADSTATAILFIPARSTTIPRDAFLLHASSVPPLAIQSFVDGQLQMRLRNAILNDVYHLEPDVLLSVEVTHIRMHTQDIATGRESFAAVKSVVATLLAVLLVLALIIFGVQVMRSVQEEKSSRMAEIIVSSVHPVQLMVGKVGGVAATAVLQLLLWMLLASAGIGAVQASSPELFAAARQQQQVRTLATKGSEATWQYNTPIALVDDTVQGLTAINLPLVASLFFLFFLLGYLFYGSVLAALAARLDSDSDALQWVLLMLSPLLVVLLLIPMLLRNPAGALAQWLAILPFTSPAVVLLRLPFGLPIWHIVAAATGLLLSFVGVAWIAARSYRRYLVR